MVQRRDSLSRRRGKALVQMEELMLVNSGDAVQGIK